MSNVFKIAQERSAPIQEFARSEKAIFRLAREKQSDRSQSEEESSFKKGLRHTARTGFDVASTVAGAPGEALNLINEYVAEPIVSSISGKKGLPYEETPLGKVLPTSKKLRENIPEYLKPKTEKEQLGSELSQDITSLLIPLPGGKSKAALQGASWLKKAGTRLGKAAGLGTSGVLAKETAEELGVDPDTAQYAKLGTVLLGSLATENGLKGAEKFKNSLYKQMEKSRPSSATVNASNVLKQAEGLRSSLKKGGKAPSMTRALEKTEELIEHIQENKGKASVEELESFARKGNELRSALYDEFILDKAGRKSAKRNLDQFTKVVNQGLEEYGKTNPKYEKLRSMANEAHGAIESSRGVSRWFEKNATNLAKGGVPGAIATAIWSPSSLIPATATALAGAGIVKGSELTARIIKSPVLRDYYLNVLDGALRNDLVFVNHNLERLSKKIDQDPELLLKD